MIDPACNVSILNKYKDSVYLSNFAKKKDKLHLFFFFTQILIVFLFMAFLKCKAYGFIEISELQEEMEYLAQKDQVLSSNIANVDTPDYRPKKITKKGQEEVFSISITDPHHIYIDAEEGEFEIRDREEVVEIKPNGNSVNLTQEMSQKSQNALKFQETSNLYDKSRMIVESVLQ